MMRLILTSLAVLACVSTAAAFDFITPTGAGNGRAVLLSAPGPGELLNLPVGTAAQKWWRIETGLYRHFDLRDLDQMFAAGGYRLGKVTLAIGYSQFGHADLYSEKLVKASAALQRESLSFGASASYTSLSFGGGYHGLSAAAVGLGAAWRSREWLLAASADNLNSPSFTSGAKGRSPTYSLHSEFLRNKSYALLGRLTVQNKERPQFGAGQRIFLRSCSALLWGFTTAPFTFGGGIDFGFNSTRLCYSANYHPILGLTQTISVSYGSVVKPTSEEDGLR